MAGLDDYQFYSKLQSPESPFWESPRRERRRNPREDNVPGFDGGAGDFGRRGRRYDDGEHFELYDVPPGRGEDEVDGETAGGSSGPFSGIFPGVTPDFGDVRSGRDAWQALFGPSKTDPAENAESEAISWAAKSHAWWLKGVSLTTEFVITHPLLVIRRQCQVNAETRRFHVFPWSTVGVVYRLAKAQGLLAFYKGFTSVLLVKGISVWTEDFLNRVTPWSSSFPRHVSLVEMCGHVAVKCGGLVAAAPFQAASLVETVQSDIASESPGFLDVLREGGYRLTCWTCPQSGRLLPIWAVVPAAVVEGVARYASTEILYRLISSVYKMFNPDQLLTTSSSATKKSSKEGSCSRSKSSGRHRSRRLRQPQQRRSLDDEDPISVDGGRGVEDAEERLLPREPEPTPTDAERVSWATKDAYNDAVFRVWATFAAHVLTYPLETVLNRLLLQGTRTIIDDLDSNGTSVVAVLGGYSGFRDCVRTIAVEEGWGGFYKGVGTLFWAYLAHFAALRLADVLLVRLLASGAEDQAKVPLQVGPVHRAAAAVAAAEAIEDPTASSVMDVSERPLPGQVALQGQWSAHQRHFPAAREGLGPRQFR